MATKPTPVAHPSWCDRARCTAPEFVPEAFEPTAGYQHRSAPVQLLAGAILMPGVVEDVEVHLYEVVAPWQCHVYLVVEVGGTRLVSVRLDEAAATLATLADVLRPALADFHADYPLLPTPGAPLFDGNRDPA